MLVMWFMREARNVQGSVPFGRSLTALSMLVLTFVPATRHAFVGWLRPSSSFDLIAWANLRDPFFDLPIGLIFLASFAVLTATVVTFGVRMSLSFLARAPDPEGEVPFVIGRDGRRLDDLPSDPFAQKMLGWILWAIGLCLLIVSTHSDAASAIVVMLALLEPHISHVVSTALMWRWATPPESLRPLLSMAEYDEIGRSHTARSLQALRAHVKDNPSLFDRVRPDAELRLRRFSDNGHHFQRALESPPDDTRSRCTIC